jgi:hypothetical protein
MQDKNEAGETLAQEARRLRTFVFGKTSDIEWAKMERSWIDDLPWLRQKFRMEETTRNRLRTVFAINPPNNLANNAPNKSNTEPSQVKKTYILLPPFKKEITQNAPVLLEEEPNKVNNNDKFVTIDKK